MRKMLIVAAALAIAFVSFSPVEAANRSGLFSSGSQTRSYRVWRGGVFDRLLELERRKNEIIFGGFRR